MEPKPITMVEYYQAQAFNPVLIRVEDPLVWQDHVRKRRHLYERHLGLPLGLLRDKRVLEFGCNSGENALVLAACGARLTFVEPNDQVAPRLEELFRAFDLGDRIDAFHQSDLGSFPTGDTFDLVVAEGFLCCLADRDALLEKLLAHVRPGGFGVTSFNDRFGGLLEMLKRAILFRAYALAPVADIQSEAALALARDFFEADFKHLNASRSFERWWRDTLVDPVYSDTYLWSYPEILPILARGGAQMCATSPGWSAWEHFTWYKNVPDPESVVPKWLAEWRCHLFYFLTGLAPAGPEAPASEAVIEEVARLVHCLSDRGHCLSLDLASPASAPLLLEYLSAHPHPQARAFAVELATLLGSLDSGSGTELLETYRAATLLRSLWGTAYHYLCFQKPLT